MMQTHIGIRLNKNVDTKVRERHDRIDLSVCVLIQTGDPD